MKLTLPVKLDPAPEQRDALVATMERFNLACDAIAVLAFQEHCANKVVLQKRVYYDIRERFGLSAQLTIRAISKVVEAYKRVGAVPRRSLVALHTLTAAAAAEVHHDAFTRWT